ncbi:MlaD family protein [Telmatospirillum siberiense]|uniref:MCE family protein n=1 Tax=Telmatospirillum siberiense TaxID=382514 RepID=A0A2N3PUA2_9PROT|nr:MlaD family protein [Telmatospirillum siberiense]PKU23982.1 MCE family protein [Telmatospirillum siberiense]
MRDSRINYVLVGSFVLAMLVALVVSIALLSGRTGRTQAYYVVYDNVGGVKYGTKVLFEGFTIGQVEDITPQRDGGKVKFKLRLGVTDGWQVPEDSVARIAASGLLAAVAIDIKGGSSATLLQPGEQIRSQSGGNLFTAMADIASEVTNLSQTGLRPLIEALNRTVGAFGPILEQRAPQLFDNLVSLSADLAAKTPKISSNVEQMTSGMNKLFSPDNTRKMEDTIGNVDRTAANLAELTGALHSSKAKVDSLLATLDKAAADNSETVGQGLKDLRYSLQAVARNIDSVTYNLEGTARNMNEFSREIRQDPGLLLGGGRPRDEGPK